MESPDPSSPLTYDEAVRKARDLAQDPGTLIPYIHQGLENARYGRGFAFLQTIPTTANAQIMSLGVTCRAPTVLMRSWGPSAVGWFGLISVRPAKFVGTQCPAESNRTNCPVNTRKQSGMVRWHITFDDVGRSTTPDTDPVLAAVGLRRLPPEAVR